MKKERGKRGERGGERRKEREERKERERSKNKEKGIYIASRCVRACVPDPRMAHMCAEDPLRINRLVASPLQAAVRMAVMVASRRKKMLQYYVCGFLLGESFSPSFGFSCFHLFFFWST